jgi:alpha-L-fucosidase
MVVVELTLHGLELDRFLTAKSLIWTAVSPLEHTWAPRKFERLCCVASSTRPDLQPLKMRALLAAVALAGAAAAGVPPPPRGDFARFDFPNPAGIGAFTAAKFGLFIHWGPVSQWGTEISFPLVCWSFPCQVMGPGNVPITITSQAQLAAHRQAYRDLAKTFNPTAFNATALAELAYAAGFRYVTPTAMHCDSFALYNSSVAANYSMRATPFGRDVTGELLAAFRSRGMRGGVYVCPSLWARDDYWAPSALTLFGGCCKPNYDPVANPGTWASFTGYLHAVVTELVDLYSPSHFWFDSGTYPLDGVDTHLEQLVPVMRTAAPDVVLHVRDGGVWHDYVTSGDHGEADVGTFLGQTYAALYGPFEIPGTLGQQWAYDPKATYATAPQVIRNLIPIVSKGGNYLLNIGLDASGVWAPAAVDTLTNLSAWFAFAGNELIHSATPVWPYNYGNVYYLGSTSQPTWSYAAFWQGWNATTGTLLLHPLKPSTLSSTLTAVRRLTPGGPVERAWNLTEAGLSVDVSDLPPPEDAPVALGTFFKATNATRVDRAPCGLRDCSVYTRAGYKAAGTEGWCSPAQTPGTPVPVYLFFNGGTDNMGGPAPPADGQAWQRVDVECYAAASDGPGLAPLQVWHSAALGDYWTLASDASRAAAQAAGYVLVDTVGYVQAAPPTPPHGPDPQAYAYVLRLEWSS